MRVLLFGATGYVGGHIARRLVAEGHDVTAPVRHTSYTAALQTDGLEVIAGDAATIVHRREFVAGFDIVVWAAQLMLEDERQVVDALTDALRGSGKTLIFTSGTSLLSQFTAGDWSDDSFAEIDDFVPRRQVAPRRAIEMSVRIAAQSDVRAMVIRPPLIWGAGGCRIIADLYHSARATGAVCYVGRGLNAYTNVHIDDLADLYVLALLRGVAGALYHAGAGEVNFRTLAHAVATQLGVGTRSITVAEAATV